MGIKNRPLLNIFSDKSSLVLRALLRDPRRAWKVLDLVKEGLSLGQVVAVMEALHNAGFVYRHRAGRASYTEVQNAKGLLEAWVAAYKFVWNRQTFYYTEKPDFLKELKAFLERKGVPFALTLYSAGRLTAPFVVDHNHYAYLGADLENVEDILREIETRFSLKQLRAGGNVLFALPFYKSSVFRDSRLLKGFPVVSNLQLYLDLMGFPPTGSEQGEWLAKRLMEKGTPLA
jgi:hypothetical protein